MATTAFHNGTTVHQGHNRRDKWIIDKESHINPTGNFEIWHDEKLTDAYERIFGRAVDNYNAKQKRSDRKIGSYYELIRQGNNDRNLVYETIIGVYKSNTSEETQREILRKVYEIWPKRYPNFEIVGAYYHADEEGEPHLHIDYVPVATGYKRGMSCQNGLVKALEQMGFVKGKINGKERFAIDKWQADGRLLLDEICRSYGIKVKHPQTNKGIPHLETSAYKVSQQLLDELETLSNQKTARENELKNEIKQLENYKKQLNNDILELKKSLEDLSADELAVQTSLSEAQNNVLRKKSELATMSYEIKQKSSKIESLRLSEGDLMATCEALASQNELLQKNITTKQKTLKDSLLADFVKENKHMLYKIFKSVARDYEYDQSDISENATLFRKTLEKFFPSLQKNRTR